VREFTVWKAIKEKASFPLDGRRRCRLVRNTVANLDSQRRWRTRNDPALCLQRHNTTTMAAIEQKHYRHHATTTTRHAPDHCTVEFSLITPLNASAQTLPFHCGYVRSSRDQQRKRRDGTAWMAFNASTLREVRGTTHSSAMSGHWWCYCGAHGR